MTILILSGSISPAIKQSYLDELARRIPNSFYLNIDHFYSVFKEPSVSQFTLQYSYEKRIRYPSHAAIIAIAAQNVRLNKVVILDGEMNDELIAQYAQHKKLDNPIFEIYFYSSLENLSREALQKFADNKILLVNVEKDFFANLQAIFKWIKITAISSDAKAVDHPATAVLTAGLPGTGKSTHCNQVHRALQGAICLDKDDINECFLESVSEALQSPYHVTHVKKQGYDVLFQIALDNLRLNRTPILEGAFGDKLTSYFVDSPLYGCRYPVTLIYFHCTAKTQLSRMQARASTRDTDALNNPGAARKNLLQKTIKDFAQVEDLAAIHVVDTDNSSALPANVSAILRHVTSTHFISLRLKERSIPFDDKHALADDELLSGGVSHFESMLTKAKEKDHHAQGFALGAILSLPSRCLIWSDTNKAVEMKAFDSREVPYLSITKK